MVKHERGGLSLDMLLIPLFGGAVAAALPRFKVKIHLGILSAHIGAPPPDSLSDIMTHTIKPRTDHYLDDNFNICSELPFLVSYHEKLVCSV